MDCGLSSFKMPQFGLLMYAYNQNVGFIAVRNYLVKMYDTLDGRSASFLAEVGSTISHAVFSYRCCAVKKWERSTS